MIPELGFDPRLSDTQTYAEMGWFAVKCFSRWLWETFSFKVVL